MKGAIIVGILLLTVSVGFALGRVTAPGNTAAASSTPSAACAIWSNLADGSAAEMATAVAPANRASSDSAIVDLSAKFAYGRAEACTR